jgi:hypothetical protein
LLNWNLNIKIRSGYRLSLLWECLDWSLDSSTCNLWSLLEHLHVLCSLLHLHLCYGHLVLKWHHYLVHWIELLVQAKVWIYLHLFENLIVILKLLNDLLNLRKCHFLCFVLCIYAIFYFVFILIFQELFEFKLHMFNFFSHIHIFGWLNIFFRLQLRCVKTSKQSHAVEEFSDFPNVGYLRITFLVLNRLPTLDF